MNLYYEVVELIVVNKKNLELSNKTWGNASQGRGPPHSTKDHQEKAQVDRKKRYKLDLYK